MIKEHIKTIFYVENGEEDEFFREVKKPSRFQHINNYCGAWITDWIPAEEAFRLGLRYRHSIVNLTTCDYSKETMANNEKLWLDLPRPKVNIHGGYDKDPSHENR